MKVGHCPNRIHAKIAKAPRDSKNDHMPCHPNPFQRHLNSNLQQSRLHSVLVNTGAKVRKNSEPCSLLPSHQSSCPRTSHDPMVGACVYPPSIRGAFLEQAYRINEWKRSVEFGKLFCKQTAEVVEVMTRIASGVWSSRSCRRRADRDVGRMRCLFFRSASSPPTLPLAPPSGKTLGRIQMGACIPCSYRSLRVRIRRGWLSARLPNFH